MAKAEGENIMADLKLFKKESTYLNEKGEERRAVRFYLQCGSALVPVEPCYFENKDLGRDPQYAGRKEVLKAFAEPLPDKEAQRQEKDGE